jgi:hypothetical protein
MQCQSAKSWVCLLPRGGQLVDMKFLLSWETWLHKLIRSNEQDQSYGIATEDEICNIMWEGRTAYKPL